MEHMPKTKQRSTAPTNDGAIVGYEARVWQMADALRGSMDAAEYRHVVLGLIKNHPWLGGNKRTATILVDRFLYLNGMALHTTVNDIVELALAIEADRWDLDTITAWYRQRTFPLSPQRSQ